MRAPNNIAKEPVAGPRAVAAAPSSRPLLRARSLTSPRATSTGPGRPAYLWWSSLPPLLLRGRPRGSLPHRPLGFLRQVDAGVYSLHNIDDQVQQMGEDIGFISDLLIADVGEGDLAASTVEVSAFPTKE